jgi:hypothetical protein
MSPTVPDPAPADQDPPDEALGEQLDRHLDLLASGTLPSAGSSTEGELPRLQQVVERLFRLAQGLSTTRSEPAVPSASTVDYPRSPGHDTSREGAPQRHQPVPDAPAPSAVGKFRVVRGLGHGGQAATLLVFDPDLKRHVVLKLYHAAHTAEEQELVLREGQALARVRSPYVAQCYSAERHEGIPFLVMEYIPGRNLSDERRVRPLSTDEALDLVGRLAEGLGAVHACGLLHRDVKPGNILIGDDGRPRLVDFGLATPLASADLSQVSGTLAYMAPEQARGQAERIDARTDLYGLGAVLYDLLTGRPPHTGSTRSHLLAAARAGDVEPAGKVNPRVPPAVSELCARCLARDPVNRYASAAELAEAVRRLRQPSRRRWPLLAAACAGLAATLVFLVVWLSRPEPPASRGPGPVAKPASGENGSELIKGEPKAGPDQVERGPRPAYLKGRKLRRDFPLHVEIIDSKYDRNRGEYRLTMHQTVQRDPQTMVHTLKEGQIVRLRVKAAETAYVGVWDVVESKKRLFQLFPNDAERKSRVPANVILLLPRSKDIKATVAVEGQEYLHVIASTWPFRKIDLPGLRQLAGPFLAVTMLEGYERMTGALRDLELVPQKGQPVLDSESGEEVPFQRLVAEERPRRVSEVVIPLRILPRQDGND